MTVPARRFPYSSRSPTLPTGSQSPFLPLVLIGAHRIAVSGLVDSGAAINVVPYSIGLQLGFDWKRQSQSVELRGYLESVEAKAIVVSAIVGDFAQVRQAFAWAESDSVPLILGQVNFFLEFDVCFFRSQLAFEVRPKGAS